MIGDYLKKCRQGTNLSLEDISSATMIKLSYLKALEDEDFQELPCEVFTRGYIRVYLEFLSLDSSEGLKIYQDEGVHKFKSNDAKNSNRVGLISAGFVKVPAEVINEPNPFNAHNLFNAPNPNPNPNPNVIDKIKPGYTRNIVYLLVLLAFLVVAVFSARAFFNVTKKSTASVTRPVDRSGNEALRDIPPSGRIHLPELAPDQTTVSGEKKAVSKSSDSKKTSPRPSGKVKESMNLMRKPAANPANPDGAGTSGGQSAPGPELRQLKDVSNVVQKMKKVASSLNSLKTSIVKVKAGAAARNSGKSANPITVEPVTPPVPSGEKGEEETIDAEKDPDRSAVDTSRVFSSSRGITGAPGSEALFVAPEGVTEQCGLSEKSSVSVSAPILTQLQQPS
ncbi:MAG: helix-turn-helix domain-containing protein [Nitrospirae bacterium]|nr:helix-turn-helix domain-containing protein [Nitrospirota bacterium]